MLRTNLLSRRYAFVDVETTGFSPASCSVVEVACLLVERGCLVAAFETLINPEQPIPWHATAVHGITDWDVAAKPPLEDVAGFVESMCDGAIVVAHNAGFDLGFLPFLRKYPSLCSYRLAARVVPEAPNHQNQTLRRFFNVKDPALKSRSAHRALADAVVTRHVFFACLHRYLGAGLPDNLRSLIAFTRRQPQLCCYELSAYRPRPPQSSSRPSMVSTTTTPKFHFR